MHTSQSAPPPLAAAPVPVYTREENLRTQFSNGEKPSSSHKRSWPASEPDSSTSADGFYRPHSAAASAAASAAVDGGTGHLLGGASANRSEAVRQRLMAPTHDSPAVQLDKLCRRQQAEADEHEKRG